MAKLGKQYSARVNPLEIKLNDDKLENSHFRNMRVTIKKEDLNTNRESIRELGLLKPLIIRPIKDDPDGYPYQLVAGSRRLRNIIRLIREAQDIIREGRPFKDKELCFDPEKGEFFPATEVYATVQVQVRECDDETAIRINIAENLEHSPVPDLDIMEFCQELVDLKKADNTPLYSRTEIAALCNRSESWVSLTLELNQLPEKVKTLLQENRVTRTGALAFLQTERDKIEEVISVGTEIVRKEKEQEIIAIDAELHHAKIELDDALNDVEIHQMMQNRAMCELAQKNVSTCEKRVSAASEKKAKVVKEAENPRLTADVINQANLLVPNAKKGAPKAMPTPRVKEMYATFKQYKEKKEENGNQEMLLSVIDSLFKVILGHTAPASVENLISLAQETSEESPEEEKTENLFDPQNN